MVLDTDGKPRPAVRLAPSSSRHARWNGCAGAPMVIVVLAAHLGEGINDLYSNTIWAKDEVRRCSTTGADAITSVEEAWSFEGREGTRLSLALRYVCGAPAYGRPDFKIYLVARPELYRIYRVEHGEGIIMSKP